MHTERHNSATIEQSLSRPEIHDGWERAYRTEAHERVTDMIFERALHAVGAPPDALWLDVGCGPGFHSLRLADHGYRVQGLDLAEDVVETARRNIAAAGMSDRVEVATGNLLRLPFEDASVGYVLCWGVLMHVPEVKLAVAELSRVLRPGGRILISENNVHSLDNLLVRVRDRVHPEGVDRRDTDLGTERWFQTPGGTLLTRQADVDALVAEFGRNGVDEVERFSGSLTELYTKLGDNAVADAVHRLNGFWFRRVRLRGPATSNLLVLERSA